MKREYFVSIPAFAVQLGRSELHLTVEIVPQSPDAPLDFACYLLRDGKVVSKKYYQKLNRFMFHLEQDQPAEYRAIGYVRHQATGDKRSVQSNSLRHPFSPSSGQEGEGTGTAAVSETGGAARQQVKSERHNIRLKGWPPLDDRWIEPKPDYLSASDNLTAKPYRVRTDRNGFIVSGRKFPVSASAGSWVFLGGSFVESIFSDESRRLVAQLEARAQKDYPGVRTLNGGYSGATTLHLINVLLNRVIPMRPNVVFFAVPSNDSRFVVQRAGYWNEDKHLSPFTPVWRPEQAEQVEHLAQLRSLLQVAKACCDAWSIRFVVMTTPHRAGDLAQDEWLRRRYASASIYERTRQLRWAVAQATRQFCLDSGTALLDLERILQNFKPLSYDDLHLHDAGADQAAPLVYRQLRRLLAAWPATAMAS